MRITSYGAEYYRHSLPTVKANTRHFFLRHTEPNITIIHFRRKSKHLTFILASIRSRILPPFISDRKSKHPTFIFSVIRTRILAPFISDRKSKHPAFMLASYGAEYYRHSFPTVKANTRHLF